ncbi:hypothetical protein BO71DRAFT_433056 [Aspergillus ellipticus CBS 707.79]|uniref:Xylanolytic transcriptional activator regulatory domain-containing protein n=1 Tax=Aspergillus ellipticus CBS 707.79 TaxID=1448320 RepID=A0A319D180_9EURO|nr:hypothetical protein BO71DRAFT_433056 [Aspergillus ellipticus CBS 707.79]
MFLGPWNTNQRVTRRKRLVRSCDTCHARKVQSDVMQQSQSATGVPIRICHAPFCEIVLPLIVNAQPTQSDSNSSSATSICKNTGESTQRVQEVPAAQDQTIDIWAPAFARNLQFASRHLGNICTFDGAHVLSTGSQEWMKSCTGSELHLDRYSTAEAPWWQHKPPTGLDLPELSFLYEEVRRYQSSVFGQFFPIIDTSLFESTVRAAYYQEFSTASPSPNSARACIFAFLALASTVNHGPRQFQLKSSVEYACEAHCLLPEVYKEQVTIDGLQTLLLLCLCPQGLAGDFFTIDQLLSAISRFLYHLKGNLSPLTVWGNPSARNCHVRHLFWIAYICDKGFSMVTGLAPVLEDSQCDLTRAGITSELDRLDGQLHIFGDPYPGSYVDIYARLALVQSQIQHNLYTPSASRKSEADLLRTIRDLDHSLEEWKDSIPLENRPSLASNSRQDFDMRPSIFHLQYHHCRR